MYEREALVAHRLRKQGAVTHDPHPENNGPAGVREVGQVLPRALIYSRPVVLAVLHSLQPLEITALSNLAAWWGGDEPRL